MKTLYVLTTYDGRTRLMLAEFARSWSAVFEIIRFKTDDFEDVRGLFHRIDYTK